MRCLKQAWPWKNECLGTRTSRTQTNHFTFYGPWLENNTPKVDIERFRNTAKIQSKFCLIIAWLASTVSFIVATHIVQKDAKLTSNAGSFGIGFTPNASQGYTQTSKMEPRSTQRPAQMHPERHLKTTKMNPQDSKIHPIQPFDWAGWRVVPWRRKYCSVGVYLSRCVGARDGQGWQRRRRW